MTHSGDDDHDQEQRGRNTLELGIVLVLFLVGTIALLAMFGPQTSRILSITSGTV